MQGHIIVLGQSAAKMKHTELSTFGLAGRAAKLRFGEHNLLDSDRTVSFCFGYITISVAANADDLLLPLMLPLLGAISLSLCIVRECGGLLDRERAYEGKIARSLGSWLGACMCTCFEEGRGMRGWHI